MPNFLDIFSLDMPIISFMLIKKGVPAISVGFNPEKSKNVQKLL